jgi:signal transduction histidine kinase
MVGEGAPPCRRLGGGFGWPRLRRGAYALGPMRSVAGRRIVTVMDAPRVRTFDVVLATVVAAALVVVMAGIESDADARSFDALAGVLVVVAAGVLALHRRAPVAVLAVTTSALALYALLDYSGGPVYFTWIGAVFAVSVARGPAKAWLPAAASTAVILFTAFHDSREVSVGGRLGQPPGSIVALFVSWAVGALLLGGSVRGRRAERAAMEERARHLVETREEEARRRVAEERVRIARDLHDSVAHSMASISVQAGVGAHVLDERPEDARATLLAIKHASGDALAELRATLGMLRSSEAAPRQPAAGLDRLPSLVEGSRAAGLPVDVVIEGDARPLPPAVDTAAFRIVQESLTNVIRHAGAARAIVAVRHSDGGVEIEVTDNGRGAVNGNGAADAGGGGHGLAGMRERVALLGGELFAGTRCSGGYRVRVRLPL